MPRKDAPYPHLFSPIEIGGMLFRNRIFNAPTTHHALSDEKPYYSEEYIAHAVNKAKGGAAAVNVGTLQIDPDRPVDNTHMRVDLSTLMSPFHIRTLIKAVDDIHFYGAKAVLETSFRGHEQYTAEDAKTRPIYGVTNHIRADGAPITEMPPEEMNRIADCHAAAAAGAVKAGFDMIQLHFGHGGVYHSFLSAITNTRTDEYGGSLENRAKFPIMVIDRIRERVGRKILIELRISGTECDTDERSFELNECIQFLRMIEDKIDLVHISAGNKRPHSRAITHPTSFLPPACNAYLATAVKAAGLKIPVMAIGAIYDPAVAEELIASGKVDAITTARGLISDPEMPNKAKAGKREDIVPCIKCLNCLDGWKGKEYHQCAVNPWFGRESRLPRLIRPIGAKKRIAVIGGGPAGMKAALVAAERGHQITLFEKTGRLGGQLCFADRVAFKYDLKNYKDYLVYQVGKNDAIQVLLSTEATPERVNADNYDAVIAGVGAIPIVPAIPGIDSAHVIYAADAYEHPELVGGSVIVVGGGQVGCETALHLTQQGKRVTILEMAGKLAADAINSCRIPLMEHLEASASYHVNARCTGIDANGVCFIDQNGHVSTLNADTVVIAVGMSGQLDLARTFYDCADEYYEIGDCTGADSVKKATRTAFDVAINL